MSDDKLKVFLGLYLAPAYGEWVEVDSSTDPDELHAKAREIVARFNREYADGAEEYATFDVDGAWAVPPGETADFEHVVWLATLTEEVGDDAQAFEKWAANEGHEYTLFEGGKRREVEEILETFREKFLGVYDDVEDYAHEVIENSCDMEKMLGNLAVYFDYEAFGRDLELGGDIWTARVDGGLAIFSNH